MDSYSYPALPERVWQALTDPRKRAMWFLQGDIVAEPGRRFTLFPGELAGLDEPIQGTVLEVVAPERLVMQWSGAQWQATVGWRVEAAPGGSRLRVTASGAIGPPDRAAIIADGLRMLFDDRLRAALSRGVIAAVAGAAPPVASAAGSAVAAGAAGSGPVVSDDPAGPIRLPGRVGRPVGVDPAGGAAAGAGRGAGATPGRIRRRRPERHRGRVVAIASTGIVLALLLAAWLLLPSGRGEDPQAGRAPRGSTTVSESAGAIPAATASPPLPSGSRALGGPGGPGGTTRPTEVAPTTTSTTIGPPLPLTLQYQITSHPPLSYVVDVTLHNPGQPSRTWRAVRATLSVLDLPLSYSGPVHDAPDPPAHCFYPNGSAATVAGGASLTFSFTVTSVLGTMKSLVLDDPACAGS